MVNMLAVLAAAALGASQPAQPVQAAPAPLPGLPYAALADLSLTAPIVAHVQLRRATRLSAEDSPGVPVGHRRF